MAEEHNARQQENRERALDRPREYPLAPSPYYAPPEEEIHLRDYLQVVLRRKWIVITFLIAVITTAAIATFTEKPLYKSTITIKIDSETPNILFFKDVYNADSYYQEDYYQTQYKILKSRNLARRVIRQMKLDASPEFSGRQGDVKLTSFLQKPDNFKEEGIDSSLVNGFIGRVEVIPQQKSRLVNVNFISYDPEMSAKVANAIGRSFIDLNIESKYEATQQAREWLEKQLETMKGRVEQAEEKLNQYAGKNEIIFLETKINDKDDRHSTTAENLVSRKLGELADQLTAATSERIQKEVLYNELKAGEAESSSIVLNNGVVQAFRKELASLESDYNQNLKTYKADYPKMVKLKELIDQTRKKMDAETKRVVSSIRKDYDTAVRKEKYLKDAFERQKKDAIDLNDRAVQYQILKREADTNKELYDGLLQRLKETGISANLNTSNIQVLDYAEVPKAPFKPDKRRNLLMALMVGLFGGIGLAFFAEYLDNTIKTPEDVEKKMYLPSLGLVPLQADNPKLKNSPRASVQENRKNLPVEYISHLDSKSQLSEAFSNLRTFLLFSSAGKPPKVMVITSPRRGEGKTTTSVNTAISLTKSDASVMIIDADMRRPRLHKIFKVSNTCGLSSFLSGNEEFGANLVKKTNIPNLDVITSGPLPPNPVELLSSYRLRELIEGIYPLYTYIIIDTPPLLGLADAAVTSTHADGVILVVKSGDTPRDAGQQARKILESINVKVLGVVLNGISETNLKYGYYSYYQYYYQNYTSDESRPGKQGK